MKNSKLLLLLASVEDTSSDSSLSLLNEGLAKKLEMSGGVLSNNGTCSSNSGCSDNSECSGNDSCTNNGCCNAGCKPQA